MDDEVHPKLSRHGVPMDDEIHHRGSSITELYWGSSNGCEVSSWVHPLLRRDGMPMDDELVAVGFTRASYLDDIYIFVQRMRYMVCLLSPAQ
jgi:hypothetical protein